MLVTIALLLSLIPAAAVLWPFIVGLGSDEFAEDESAPVADLMRRWDAAVAGLRSTELEHAIGNLADADYRAVRRQLMTEAALVLRTMELEEAEEKRLLDTVRREAREVRSRVQGPSQPGVRGEDPPRDPEPGA